MPNKLLRPLEERREETCMQWPLYSLQLQVLRPGRESLIPSVSYWITDRIFFDAEDAEAHVAAAPHHFDPKERETEWRINCLPAAGRYMHAIFNLLEHLRVEAAKPHQDDPNKTDNQNSWARGYSFAVHQLAGMAKVSGQPPSKWELKGEEPA